MPEDKHPFSVSDKMARLIYVERQLFFGIGLLVLGISGLIGSFFLYRLMESNFQYQLEHPGYFDSYSPAGYSTVNVQYMTEYFAEHIQEKYLLYFGFDSTSKPFILCGEERLPEELKAILEYTYGNEEDPMPDPVSVSGFCRPLDSEIMGFARDSYSTMWSESEQIPISSDELSTMVGNYYLDIRPSTFQKEHPWAKWIFLLPAVLLIAGTAGMTRYRKRIKSCHKRMESFSGWISQADGELSQTEPFEKGLPLYLTRHYLVTAVYYFDIIPLARITELPGSPNILTVVTDDGSRHMVMERRRCPKGYERLKTELEKRIRESRIEAELCGGYEQQ